MSSLSSFVDTLAEIINKETASVFQQWKKVDSKSEPNHEAASQSQIDSKQQTTLEKIQLHPHEQSSVSKILDEFALSCNNLANHFSNTVDVPSDLPLRPPALSPGHPTNLLYPRLSASFADTIALELEHLIMTSCMYWRTSTRDKKLLTSFILRDMEQAVRKVLDNCTEQLEDKFFSSSLRLGHIYAWARDSSSTGGEDSETADSTRPLKRRIRSRLSRLVLLCRAGKRNIRSHPLLTSMRHELLRIRTQLTSSDRTAAMGSVHIKDNFELSDWEDNGDSVLGRFVPSNLCPAFCQLVDQLTDVFLELPAQVPGVSAPATQPSASSSTSLSPPDRRSRWRNVISQTVLNFYNHQDAWAGLDLQVEDRIAQLQASGDALLALFNAPSDSSDTDGDTEQTKQHTSQHTLSGMINPSVVQAVLDRFDHQNRGGNTRKRHFSGTGDQFDEETGPAPKLTRSKAVGEESATKAKRSDPSPTHSVDMDAQMGSRRSNSPELKSGSAADALNSSNATERNTRTRTRSSSSSSSASSSSARSSSASSSPSPRQSRARNKTDKSRSSSSSSSSASPSPTRSAKPSGTSTTNKPPRRSNRSLRTRRSRTPSEASYSEGEVLSDSDEDREEDRASSADEVVPDILGEKTNIEGPDEERAAAEIIQMMAHKQLRDATPVSDIDLTELEIMDEWATPAAKRTEAESSEPAEAGGGSCGKPNNDVAERSSGVEKTNSNLSDLISQAIATCGEDLDRLLSDARDSRDGLGDSNFKGKSAVTEIHLSDEVEANIERTASVFKEHVTSVLANLLHAANDPNGTSPIVKRQPAQPVVCARRGARLLGMLKAYQQDAAKRMTNPNLI